MAIRVRDFMPRRAEFEEVVTCYQAGFPEGHNRYSLSRLARFQRDTILVAEDLADSGIRRIVGVIIGIASPKEAWLTGMSVLPDPEYRFGACSFRLLEALALRFAALGFREAFGTTCRPGIDALAQRIGAELLRVEDDYYFDGQHRTVYRGTLETLPRLKALVRTVGFDN